MKTLKRMARFHVGLVALALLSISSAPPADAQDYPTRPIRIISPVPAGGLSDVALRPVAQELSKSLGQPVIVDNRPGAGGTLAGRACAQAAADGYTICNFFNDVISNAPFLFKNLAYDPYRDFVPITNGYFIITAFLVTPSLNVNSLAELHRAVEEPPRWDQLRVAVDRRDHVHRELQPAHRREVSNHPLQERQRGRQCAAHQDRAGGRGRHRDAGAASASRHVQGAFGRFGGASGLLPNVPRSRSSATTRSGSRPGTGSSPRPARRPRSARNCMSIS